MAIITKTNSKVIKDPLYTPVIKFLKDRIAQLEIDDPDNELELARERYTGLIAGDLVIEDPVSFPDGVIRVCIVSRKTGFARADVEVKRVTIKEILEDFKVSFVEINDVDELKAFAKSGPQEATLLWLNYKNTYGVLLNQENAKAVSGMQKAFGGLFFNTYTSTRESLTTIDYDTLESGIVKVTDDAFGMGEYPLFIYELVKAEADLPEITSNLPTEITTSRGKDFSIPNTYWFGGIEDITLTAQVDITTESGYTIPRRSDDKLKLEGETIFGDADKEVTDAILVRVTHMYMGRPVKKTFRIKVIIEKDEQLDLTFEVTPPEITASKGDTVEVSVKAFFRGVQVTLSIPAAKFVSKKLYGDLSFVETLADGSMIYRGAITGNLPGGVDKDTELYQGDFQYTDSGTLYRAPAYVNMIVVKPEARPKFEITSVTTTLRGFKGDTGFMIVEAKYGDTPVSTLDLGIKTGVKGVQGLVRFDSVVEGGVNFTIIKDSGVDGQSMLDSFLQNFTWVDPYGVRNDRQYTINVEARRKSVYEVVPGPTPLTVDRYQTGSKTFTFMMNGSDQSSLVTDLHVADDNGLIINEPKAPGVWRVIKASTTEDTPVKVKFEFWVVIDTVNTRFVYEQDFVIRKYATGTGENINVVAVPSLLIATGKTDENGSYKFKVFKDAEDISQNVAIVDAFTEIPDQLKFGILRFDATDGYLVLDYTKNKSGKGTGRIALAEKTVTNPTPDQRAVVMLDADIEQSRTFKLIEWPEAPRVLVEEQVDYKPVFEFAGVVVPLNDPNLKITQTKVSDLTFVGRKADAITMVDNYWRYLGTTTNVGMEMEFVYTDPLNSANVTRIVKVVTLIVTFPPIRLVWDKDPINASIWDTGTFPIKLMAGDKDWTSATTMVSVPGGNKYIGTSGYNWTVVNAERTKTTTTVPLKIEFKVGESVGNFLTDAVFNLEAWDQITFGVTYQPHEIKANSGDTGQVVATFVYKGKDVTNKVTLVKASSTIPDTFEFLDNGRYVEGTGFVLDYKTKRGGVHPMNLVFQRTEGPETVAAAISTDITWPDGLNVDISGDSIRGFYKDQIAYPLTINISGQPLGLTSPNIAIEFNSGTDNPIALLEVKDTELDLSLDKGGNEGTTYQYPVTIKITYTKVATGEKQTQTLNVPGSIRVSAVSIGNNPTESVKVYDSGKLRVRLVDERGLNVPIVEFAPRGTNPYVAFETPDGWYVTQGSLTTAVETTLPLTLKYNNGGLQRTIDAGVLFNIAKFDGVDLKGTVTPATVKGKAGFAGELQFAFLYKGKPYTSMVYDDANSSMPKNLATLPYDPATGKVTYTLVGQAVDNAKFAFRMPSASTPGVEGKDKLTFNVPVESISSDETFTLGNHSDSVAMYWKGTDLLSIAMKYGEYDLPANAPGLKYTITGKNGAKDNYVSISDKTKDGIKIRGERSNIPNGVETFSFQLDIEYEVGAPTPKKVSFDFTAKITMGVVEITNNDGFRAVSIWEKGSFPQQLKTPEAGIVVDHFELQTPDNKYLELTPPRGYEVIGAEPTTSDQPIPLRAFYKVDATDTLQYVDFNAVFRITGSTSVRFKVIATPNKIETGLDLDTTISFRPVYKDQNVGPAATFKQALSTVPPQVVIKETKINGILHEITFTGKKGGLAQTKVVFWSPDAGTAPKPRDVVELTLDTQVLGELTLEVGDRDNLLKGTHKDTGTYKLELLFGLIPMDIASEISKGNLTITRETGALTMPNAFVLNPTTWHANTFDYQLAGPVAPGQTVNVSDFLNVAYKFGGNTYTRRIEIPLEYTTPAAVATAGTIVGTTTNPEKMWSTRSLSPVLQCADVTITSSQYPLQRLAYTDSGKGKYVWIKDQLALSVTVEGSETVGLTNQQIPFRFFATYRNWEYQTDVTFLYTVEPWDGKTFKVISDTTSIAGMLDTTRVVKLYGLYRGTRIPLRTENWDSHNNLKGIMSLDWQRDTGSGTALVSEWQSVLREQGKETFTLRFNRDPAVTDGVEWLDYASFDLAVDSQVAPLVLSGFTNPVTGGNLDTLSSGTPKVTLLGANIPMNDPLLKITLENELAVKIKDRAAAAMNYTVTAPLETAIDTVIPTKVSFSYTSPSTGRTHVAEFILNLKYRLPDDYPKWVTKLGRDFGNNDLWKPYAVPFAITASGASIVDQCQFISITPLEKDGGWFIKNPNYPTDKNWLFCSSAIGSNAWAWRTQTIVFKAPFRGGWIDGSVDVEWHFTNIWNKNVFTATPASAAVEFDLAQEFEIKIDIVKYGAPWLKGVLDSASAQTSPSKEKLTDYFDILGTRYDTTSTYLKLKNKKPYTGDIVLPWYDSQESIATPVANINTASVTLKLIPGLVAVPNPGASKQIFRRYNLPFKIMSGDTDITATDVTLNSVVGPNGDVDAAKINVGTAGAAAGNWGGVAWTQGPTWLPLKADKTATAVEFTFVVTASAKYGGKQLTVKQVVQVDAWDQVQFRIKQMVGLVLNRFPGATPDAPVYDTDGNLVLAFPYVPGANSSYIQYHLESFNTTAQPWIPTYSGVPQSGYNVLPDIASITTAAAGVMEGVAGSTSSAAGTYTTFKVLKVGEAVGTFYVDWCFGSAPSVGTKVNEWPGLSMDKNRIGIKAKFIGFEDVISWAKGVAPAQVSGAYQATVPVNTDGVIYGPLKSVPLNGTNVTITSQNTNIATIATTGKTDKGFSIVIAYNNAGTDLLVDVPIRISWTPVAGLTKTLDYVQKVLVKGSGTVDPVPEIVEVTPISTKMFAYGSNAGFKISYAGKIYTPTYTDEYMKAATVESEGYVGLFQRANTIWSVINADATEKVVNVKYIFNFTDGVRVIPMTATVPFTIAAWNGKFLEVTNRGSGTTPVKTYVNGVGITDSILLWKGDVITMTNLTLWDVDKAEFETLNPGLLWSRKYSSSPANHAIFEFKVGSPFHGKVKYPFYYTGPNADPVRENNKLLVEDDFEFLGYEEKLYFYPDDVEPDQVEGKFGDAIGIPVNFSVGKNIDVNQVGLNQSGRSYGITGNDNRLISLDAGTIGNNSFGIKIVYDNRGDDFLIEMPFFYSLNAFNGHSGLAMRRDWSQKVLIKGTKEGDTTVATGVANLTVNVFQTGNAGFDIMHNGILVPTGWYKSVTIKPNDYVRTNPAYDPTAPKTRVWEVYNGTADGITVPVTYIAVFYDGHKDVTLEVEAQFTIRPYDGIPLKLEMLFMPAQVDGGWSALRPSQTAQFRFSGQFAGKNIDWSKMVALYGPELNPQFVEVYSQGPNTPSSSNGNRGDLWVNLTANTLAEMQAKGLDQNPNDVQIKIGFADRINAADAKEGVDYAWVKWKAIMYLSDQWYVISKPASITGRFGDTTRGAPFTIRLGTDRRSLVWLTQLVPIVENEGNLVIIYQNSDNASNVSYRFGRELTTAPSVTLDTIFYLGTQDKTKAAKAIVPVTQISNLVFPEITNVTPVTGAIADTGPLPFKVMKGTEDLTSSATLKSISANNYVGIVDGKWCILNADATDTTVTVKMTVSVPVNSASVDLTTDVAFNIKAWDGNFIITDVQSVNGKVWDKGTALPFKVKTGIGGKEVPASWITGVSVVSPNSRVEAGPGSDKPWKIIAGDLTQAVTEEVTYTITVNSGKVVKTPTQKVLFNIEKYNGVELQLYVTGDGNDGDYFSIRSGGGSVSNTAVRVSGKLKGEPTPLTHVSWTYGSGINSQTVNQSSGTSLVYTFFPNNNYQGASFIEVTAKVTGSSSPAQQTKLRVPLAIWASAAYIFIEGPNPVTGKLGDVMDVNVIGYSADQRLDFIETANTLTFTPADVIELVPGSGTKKGFKVRFLADVDTVTSKAVNVKAKAATGPAYEGTFTINTTQTPSQVPEIADVQDVTAKIFDKGPLPFKVMYKGADVTSECTLTGISTNSSVRKGEGNTWEVFNAATAESTVVPEFTITHGTGVNMITLKQAVKFTVKGWNGKLLKPVGDDSVGVISKTGQIHIGGSFGDGSLYPDTTVDVASVDGKGIITVTKVEKATDDGLLLTYTGDAVGTEDITIRVKAIADSGNAIEGSDFADVTVNVRILPATLTPSADFESDVIGDKYNPAVVKQSIIA